jgi:hypothetical protein
MMSSPDDDGGGEWHDVPLRRGARHRDDTAPPRDRGGGCAVRVSSLTLVRTVGVAAWAAEPFKPGEAFNALSAGDSAIESLVKPHPVLAITPSLGIIGDSTGRLVVDIMVPGSHDGKLRLKPWDIVTIAPPPDDASVARYITRTGYWRGQVPAYEVRRVKRSLLRAVKKELAHRYPDDPLHALGKLFVVDGVWHTAVWYLPPPPDRASQTFAGYIVVPLARCGSAGGGDAVACGHGRLGRGGTGVAVNVVRSYSRANYYTVMKWTKTCIVGTVTAAARTVALLRLMTELDSKAAYLVSDKAAAADSISTTTTAGQLRRPSGPEDTEDYLTTTFNYEDAPTGHRY